MEALLKRHTLFWKDKTTMYHTLLSVVLLIACLFLTYFSRIYANDHQGYVVPDILLDNIPVFNVGYVFFQGAFTFLLVVLGILLWEPLYIPFTLECSALFFFVRSFFMVMTHLSAPSVEYYKYVEHEHHVANVLFTVSSGNDQFFSAHTGFPFLLALLFWHYKPFRFFFLLCSLIGGLAVILGHLHYSIDVFSSFFIAFGVFEISKHFFKKEYSYLKK
jgi:hypothetical protein